MEITREQLVDALQEFHLWITPDPAYKDVGRRCVVGTVQDPESMADGLLLALRADAAHEDRDVVDAHICCEHAGTGDGELLAMAALMPALPMVGKLGFPAIPMTRPPAPHPGAGGRPPQGETTEMCDECTYPGELAQQEPDEYEEEPQCLAAHCPVDAQGRCDWPRCAPGA